MTKVSKTNLNKVIKESHQRGTTAFPLQYSFCDTTNPFFDLWLHWHNEFEIIHIIDGTYNMQINEHEENLEAGTICLIPGKIIHGDAPEKGESHFESIVFDVDLVRLHGYSPDNFIKEVKNDDINLLNIIRTPDENLSAITENLFSSAKSRCDGWELICTGLLIAIFGYIKKNGLYQDMSLIPDRLKLRNDKMDVVIKLIQEHYSEDLSLDYMAETAGFSSKYFCRVFKEITDKAPIEYLNWFRVNKACAMIRETDEKLQDIALKCGFNDLSYFVKTFKKYKNTTPLKYRNTDPMRQKK